LQVCRFVIFIGSMLHQLLGIHTLLLPVETAKYMLIYQIIFQVASKKQQKNPRDR